MKKLILLLFVFTGFTNFYAQDITGQWNGVLKEMNLRLVVHITKTEDGYSSTLDSPDQGAKGIPVAITTFENNTLKLEAANLGITYFGEFVDGTFNGTFMQSGFKIPLILGREEVEKVNINRPQEPKEPYPYYTEDVSFDNTKASIKLAGTLTLPKKEGKFPVVVLISGSGPQDRNEELLGHKPFLIISDYLTRNGIGVLRFDDRGVGKSTGNFSTATSADFATDIESAISYLKSRKEIDVTKIGLVGHSEGGVIAPMVAAKSEDVSYIVLLAGTGIRGDKLLLLQQELIGRAMGMSEVQLQSSKELSTVVFEMIVSSTITQDLKTDVKKYIAEEINKLSNEELPAGISKDEESINGQVDQLTTPWMVYFMKHDPAKVLENVSCPVLAINGEKDLQVPPKENLEAIRKALEKGGNTDISTQELPGLNHLFQESVTGAPSEYGTIEQTFAPEALEVISSWILKKVN
ncbi:alpha/beta hydrolase family protein [Maribacter sp. 2308TA10-17]|uniref:alpha/beta hydrolase family protein n=1 Tax=Maribacter sp. 2308TA10-17 TaxID=3386276 RepID=UPI0039BD3C04